MLGTADGSCAKVTSCARVQATPVALCFTPRSIRRGIMNPAGSITRIPTVSTGTANPTPQFWTATAIATIVVFVELWAIAWVQNRYMETTFWRVTLQVVIGGTLLLRLRPSLPTF